MFDENDRLKLIQRDTLSTMAWCTSTGGCHHDRFLSTILWNTLEELMDDRFEEHLKEAKSGNQSGLRFFIKTALWTKISQGYTVETYVRMGSP